VLTLISLSASITKEEDKNLETQRVNVTKGAPRVILVEEDFAAARLPLLQASMLPPYCYTSREFYELEVENPQKAPEMVERLTREESHPQAA
jgi:hypothetical protein